MYPILIYYYYLLLGLLGTEMVRQKSAKSRVNKIVGFREDIPIAESQQLVEAYGIKVKKHLPLANACVCEVESDTAQIQSLLMDRQVEFIEDDLEVNILVMPTRSRAFALQSQKIPWGVTRIQAPKVWNNIKGEGVKVGIIDTGIDRNHPDLKDNIAGVCGVLDCKNLDDDNGHGTHVAGIIAAADNRIGVVGAAPGARLFPVKAFDEKGRGQISNIIDALERCMENEVQVINMSFGFNKRSRALERAIREVNKSGIILVAAAGNSGGVNTVMYPAKYHEVIAVAAVDSKDKVADFSSTGPEVDIIAPGVDINSTFIGGTYKSLSGTSMAAPHVTAAVALLLSPSHAGSEAVRASLLATAEDLGHPKEKQGAGLPYVPGAVKNMKYKGGSYESIRRDEETDPGEGQEY